MKKIAIFRVYNSAHEDLKWDLTVEFKNVEANINQQMWHNMLAE